jgi:putative alpha-1,2-mannosidase
MKRPGQEFYAFRLPITSLITAVLLVILASSCDPDLQTEKSQILEEEITGFVDYVNVFMGTAGDHGQLSPSASLPFGMVKLGPETEPTNHSGYDYNAKKFKEFSHTRTEGVGCKGAGGNILKSLVQGL